MLEGRRLTGKVGGASCVCLARVRSSVVSEAVRVDGGGDECVTPAAALIAVAATFI